MLWETADHTSGARTLGITHQLQLAEGAPRDIRPWPCSLLSPSWACLRDKLRHKDTSAAGKSHAVCTKLQVTSRAAWRRQAGSDSIYHHKALCSLSRTAVTRVASNSQSVSCHHPGGWKCKIRTAARPCSLCRLQGGSSLGAPGPVAAELYLRQLI